MLDVDADPEHEEEQSDSGEKRGHGCYGDLLLDDPSVLVGGNLIHEEPNGEKQADGHE